MEDDKKKKRNKKKKNKQQNKTASEEDSAVSVVDQNSDHDKASEAVALQTADVDFDRHRPNGLGAPNATLEGEKQQWLKREAALEETIKQLRDENNMHMQKMATSEETIIYLHNQNGSCIQKEATFEETIKHLQNQNDSYKQKEAAFEDTIMRLRNNNDLHMQKEADLELNIVRLQSEKDSWLQKEAGLEEKLNQLVDEKAALGLELASLAERIKQLESEKDAWIATEASLGERIKQLESEKVAWIATEITTTETITRMNVDITRVRMQVVELEESRNSLLKENQQLMENISGLQLQLRNIEASSSAALALDEVKKHASEHEYLNYQIEAACALVDKLITENAELVEKVNELYVKLDRQMTAAGPFSANGSDYTVGNGEIPSIANSLFEISEDVSVMNRKLDVEHTAVVPYSSEAESGEIVQIPLEDNEFRDLELQTVEGDTKDVVPLTDAPLIGAPFRLISYVAKYVSGADLMDKNSSNQGHN